MHMHLSAAPSILFLLLPALQNYVAAWIYKLVQGTKSKESNGEECTQQRSIKIQLPVSIR